MKVSIKQRISTIVNSMRERLDVHGHDILIPLLIVLVGVVNFSLGRLSRLSEPPPVLMRMSPVSKDMPRIPGGLVVGSRSGSVYHFPWCPGAETMKESNKVWFKDEEAARKAGYSPAKNCPGLE